jgi:hypothetical protein
VPLPAIDWDKCCKEEKKNCSVSLQDSPGEQGRLFGAHALSGAEIWRAPKAYARLRMGAGGVKNAGSPHSVVEPLGPVGRERMVCARKQVPLILSPRAPVLCRKKLGENQALVYVYHLYAEYLWITPENWGRDSIAECLLSKYEALSSTPQYHQKTTSWETLNLRWTSWLKGNKQLKQLKLKKQIWISLWCKVVNIVHAFASHLCRNLAEIKF